MKSKIMLLVMIVSCFFLQCTLFKSISLASITPNLLLILCVSMGLMRGKKSGIFVGFFSGLLIDVFYGTLPGFYALLYMYIGYLSGFFYKIYYDNTLRVPAAMVAVGDLFYGLAVYGLQFLLRSRLNFGFYLMRIIIPELLVTVIWTVILYRFFYQINHRFQDTDRKERNTIWLVK